MLDPTQIKIGKIYKTESGRVLASLIRILGDLDLAEEALHDAFTVAMLKWPSEGIPNNPYSWLISTGKFKAIDSLRKSGREEKLLESAQSNISNDINSIDETKLIEDDQLRLIFYCCHPLLPLDSRIALSLREVCTMSTVEIARAYLVPFETIKKRISRAKRLIKDKNIPYEIPSKSELSERMNAVLHVIYLIFNEGYASSSGDNHIREDLTEEAIYLNRKLIELNPTSESLGLLALLLLQDSRKKSRVTVDGDLISLEDQDRSLWNRAYINEGVYLIQSAVMSGLLGPYTLQAAIASVHAVAESVEKTQWELIVDYYDMLLSINPSPVVELNRAIAVGMHEGADAGLVIINRLLKNKKLKTYHTIYVAKADFSEKLGLIDEAIVAYQHALELVSQLPETRYIKKRLTQIM